MLELAPGDELLPPEDCAAAAMTLPPMKAAVRSRIFPFDIGRSCAETSPRHAESRAAAGFPQIEYFYGKGEPCAALGVCGARARERCRAYHAPRRCGDTARYYIPTTLAPTFTRSYRSMTSSLRRRMQPDETFWPIVHGSFEPWMRKSVEPI